MDHCLCKRYGKTVTHSENHPCYIHKKFDYRYSQLRPVESNKNHDEVKDKSTENLNDSTRCLSGAAGQNKNKKSEFMNWLLFQNNERVNSLFSKDKSCTTFRKNFINEQRTNSCDSSYYNPISDVQMTEVQTNEKASFTASSENVESTHRPEYDQHETDKNMIVVIGSSGIDLQNQKGSGVSDLIYATTDDGCKMSLEDSKSGSLNKNKKDFMDIIEFYKRNGLSDNNNISGTAKSTVHPDLSPGSKRPKNGKRQVAEDVNDENISLQMHSQGHNKNEKKHISSNKEDNAVAGPSGICPRKKKFPKIFSRKDTLKTNYRTNIDEKPFVCYICKKQFSQKSHLDEHYRTHTGETPYVCDVCGRKFSQMGNHKRHYRTHTGERPFVCEFCGKGFTYKDNLKMHVRIHTGETPFVCEVCNKAFAQKGNFKAHARTHTGEKPYKCPICGKAFTTSNNCNKHRRRVHK